MILVELKDPELNHLTNAFIPAHRSTMPQVIKWRGVLFARDYDFKQDYIFRQVVPYELPDVIP